MLEEEVLHFSITSDHFNRIIELSPICGQLLNLVEIVALLKIFLCILDSTKLVFEM
jgi:hypothetical protein